MIENVDIPVPDLNVQEQVVTEVCEVLEDVQRVGGQVRQVLNGAEFLRRSLLGEAFAGRLVKQDPADEPASMLLQHIREQRHAQSLVRRT